MRFTLQTFPRGRVSRHRPDFSRTLTSLSECRHTHDSSLARLGAGSAQFARATGGSRGSVSSHKCGRCEHRAWALDPPVLSDPPSRPRPQPRTVPRR